MPRQVTAGVWTRISRAIACAWSCIWFQDRPTTPLEISRIGIGGAILLHYLLATPYLYLFWGDDGWMPRAVLAKEAASPYAQSLFFYFNAPWQIAAFHAFFLFCCAAFMLGWRTSWVKWIVLIGQLSYDNRNANMGYGVDQILPCLLFLLCLAPIGGALSLDRVRAVRRAKRKNLAARLPQFTSRWGFACRRLMQLQMAIVLFFSASEKMRGDVWWQGDAVWHVFTDANYHNGFLLDLLSSQYWIVNLATYGTLVIEIAYPFLIWGRKTRPFALAGAIFLHLNFAFLMRLYYFSFTMIMGHFSFVHPEWLHALGAWWKKKFGPMEMIYDGHCGFCKRSMAWFLAFDGLGQISVRDYRKNPSPIVSSKRMDKALHLVLPDGRALPGFEAYRYAVLRVPGLWWMIPFFYVPGLSRFFGHPIYNWVAANRSTLSKIY
jgi:predicted DCC family thiol-disulfide oxidoreductase YuxK